LFGRFTEEPLVAEDLETIIAAGRAASSWKNFQSYSIVVIQTEAKKQALYQRRIEKQYKEIEDLTQELNNKPHWIFNTILCFLIIDFIFSVWIFCQIPFTK
jgi:nitroreductase